MDCSDVRENLAAFVDNELREGDMRTVDAHLSICPVCAAERDAIQNLMLAAATLAPSTHASILPRIRQEIDRDIILSLVEQVSALKSEVQALRSEMRLMQSPKPTEEDYVALAQERTKSLREHIKAVMNTDAESQTDQQEGVSDHWSLAIS